METKKNGRKLVLNKKTIVDLSEVETSVPRGGAGSDYCTERAPRCWGSKWDCGFTFVGDPACTIECTFGAPCNTHGCTPGCTE